MSFFKRHQNAYSEDHEDDDSAIDPELRLRTVRTAASAIAESIQSERRAERRKTVRQKRSRFFFKSDKQKTSPSEPPPPQDKAPGARRNIYVNCPLSVREVDSTGEPLVKYVRNKVRTSKYTIISFVPKNLYEQFRRVANLYFLGLVILQIFPVFGAATGDIAFLPLAFILAVTAIKDGIEDYRRATLDEEVNCSAVTRLGSWHNVNQPTDARPFIQKVLGINPPGRVTRGVRRLREKEAGEGMRVVPRPVDDERYSTSENRSTLSLSDRNIGVGAAGRRLEDIQSIDEHSYPPDALSKRSRSSTLGSTFALAGPTDDAGLRNTTSLHSIDLSSLPQYAPSTLSRSTLGVINQQVHPRGVARWERTLWKKLEVGDIVLLREDEQVPADVIVLASSDSDGLCYLETKNLDGETNLKPRRACRATASIVSEEDIERASFWIDSEGPHANLYTFHALLKYKDSTGQTGEEKVEALSINELLLRGCTLRNTKWVIGLVAFTGSDTKIMLNGGDTPSKRSKIEKETNFNVVVNFVVLFTMCIIAAICGGVQQGRSDTSEDFFEKGSEPTNTPAINAIVTFVSCLIAFQNIVPISLYISIEIVKTIQAYFISQDIDMYSETYDSSCVPKTWNISDDLGQIEYIFSDKTGTLTQNIMEFQRCSARGISYGEGITEAQRGSAIRARMDQFGDANQINEKLETQKEAMITTMEQAFKNRYLQTERLTLISPKLADDLTDRTSTQRSHLIAFFRALALCHTVLSERKKDPGQGVQMGTERVVLTYKAESPDEAALVAAARDVGFPFVGRTKEWVDIEVLGQAERYVLLRTLEFNSTRKRMSVVVRNPEGRIVLYCKGADSVIYERLAKDHDPKIKASTERDLEAFANNGLRTLCVAFRYVEEEEYLKWSMVHDAALNALEDREEQIEKANDMIEHSLSILGATALEDKLQEGVPEAIEMLHRAGIKLWILTGDKLQTAIEIGYSCNLLKSDMELMILSADGPENARAQIEAGLNKIASVLGPPTWDPKQRGFVPGAKAAFAVVIDGETLRHALLPEIKPLFLNLGTQCETVVCCRVSPAQKALTVKLVKEGRDAMTLSIGDGANDVAMIQEANIGCGLFGLEGSQASMSADYAFGQFRFLTKLLLVHGRWSYQRIADMHSNFFYKNVIWTFAMFWYLPYNSFDATYLYQYTFILLYNLAFTSLPVIVLGAFDQDINAKAALAFPQLYVRGIRGLEYTRTKFWLYMMDGFYQSAVVFFIPYVVWTVSLPVSHTGRAMDALPDFGTTVAVAAIFAANTFVGINTKYWTVITWAVVFGSSIVMLAWVVIYSFYDSADFTQEVVILFGEVSFWTTLIFTILLALAPRFISKFASTAYRPLDKEIIREAWVCGDLKDRLGLGHRNPKKNSLAREATDKLEYVPILNPPHARSGSSASLINQQEPRSDGDTNDRILPRSASPDIVQPGSSHSGRTPLGSASPRQHLQPNDTQRSPGSMSPPDRQLSPSPNPSYYSASEIPMPSPLPPPVYRLTSGEFTNTPPPRRSISLRPTGNSIDLHGSPAHRPTSQEPLQATRTSTNGGAYEMQVRSRSPPTSSITRVGSEASYATAQDDWLVVEHQERTTVPDDDSATVTADRHSRRESNGSWVGGRAL